MHKLAVVSFLFRIYIFEGNFGIVYKGIWDGTSVALKLLNSEEVFDEFLNEVKLLKSVNHPNVVRFLGIFEKEPNQKMIVMVLEGKDSGFNIAGVFGQRKSLDFTVNSRIQSTN